MGFRREFTGSHAAVDPYILEQLNVVSREVVDWNRPRNQRWQNMHFLEGTIFVLKRWRFWIDHKVTILD